MSRPDLAVIWEFPIGTLRAVSMMFDIFTLRILAEGDNGHLAGLVCCLGVAGSCLWMLLWAYLSLSGRIDIESEKMKKVEMTYTVVSGMILLCFGLVMIVSLFSDRPGCSCETCHQIWNLGIAGAGLTIFKSLIYLCIGYLIFWSCPAVSDLFR